MSLKWKAPTAKFSQDALQDLFANRIGSIVCSGFLNEQENAELWSRLDREGFGQYEYGYDEADVPQATHIFDTHYLFESKSIDDYRQSCQRSTEVYRRVCQDMAFDPVDRLLRLVQSHNADAVTIAREQDFAYFPCIARELNDSVLLHADFAPYTAGTWSIQDVVAELAWNIYLSKPKSGGECEVFNRPWILRDNAHIVAQTYGYDGSVVAGAESLKIAPKAGELVLFNSRNFHQVLKAEGRRVALGGHLGLLPDGRILAWS